MALEKPVDTVLEIVRMGKEVTPGHEALWAFVRGCVIGMEGILYESDQQRVIKVIRDYVKELEEARGLRAVEKKNLVALKRLSLLSDKARLMLTIESMRSGVGINDNPWILNRT